MRNKRFIAATVMGLALVVGSATTTPATAKDGPKLEIQAMTGIPAAYTGAAPAVRGLNGGGLPWVIGSVDGEVSRSGKVELEFRGLVLDPADPAVIARGLGGVNPVAVMKVVVSCLARDGSVANVSTPTVPVTTGAGGGDGSVEARVSLPSTCLAPTVFITTANDRWLAVSSL